MRAIDTNVLLRLLVRDDPEQTSSAEEFTASGAWVSTLVLAEATWVLESVYDRRAPDLIAALEKLLEHDGLTIQDHDVAAAALALFRGKPSLGFSDCLIVESARRAGHLPLGTFDRGLSRVTGAQKL